MRSRALVLVAVLACSACGVREEGLAVEVTVTLSPLGSDGQFDTATLAVEQLALAPCQTVRWWQRLSPLSTAWAHGTQMEGSPLVVAQPTLLDLTSAEPRTLGTLHPPPGTYCALEVQFAPSTVDAHSQGTTLLLEGTWQGTALRQLSTRKLKLSVPLDHQTLDDARLSLSVALQLTAAPPAQTGDETLEATLATLR